MRAAEFAASHSGLLQLEKKRAHFTAASETESQIWADIVKFVQREDAKQSDTHARLFSLWGRKVGSVQILSDEFDLNAPFGTNPVHRNPGTKAPGEDKIKDEWVRYEYRQHYHQREYVRKLIGRVNAVLDKKARRCRMNIDHHPVDMKVEL